MSEQLTTQEYVEELRATLLEYDESIVLEALILNNIINRNSGEVTDYWLNLLDPDLTDSKSMKAEEDIVLSALSKILKRRINR